MRVNPNSMNVLGEKYATIVLTQLYLAEGSLKISDFLDLIKNYRTIEILSKKLEEGGLIVIVTEIGRYSVKKLSLTEKGSDIAAALVEIFKNKL